jgi:hypothetical protein
MNEAVGISVRGFTAGAVESNLPVALTRICCRVRTLRRSLRVRFA